MKLLKIVEKKYFLSFEYRCVYDIKFTNLTNNEELFLPIALGFMESKSEYYGLNRKNARNNGFVINQILKLTIKVYSDLSRMNICHLLNIQIPMCHRKSF